MSNWAPHRPLNRSNGLFTMEENDQAPKILHRTPMQQVRDKDGTPPTVCGRLAFVPQGPELKLGEFESVNKSIAPAPSLEERVTKAHAEAISIVKSFLNS